MLRFPHGDVWPMLADCWTRFIKQKPAPAFAYGRMSIQPGRDMVQAQMLERLNRKEVESSNLSFEWENK
jgi:hypothetical protein